MTGDKKPPYRRCPSTRRLKRMLRLLLVCATSLTLVAWLRSTYAVDDLSVGLTGNHAFGIISGRGLVAIQVYSGRAAEGERNTVRLGLPEWSHEFLLSHHFWFSDSNIGGGQWRIRSLVVPWWLVCSCAALSTALFVSWTWIVRWHRRRRGCCTRCGYCMTGNTSGVCPECGTAVQNKNTTRAATTPSQRRKRTDGGRRRHRRPAGDV